jgi:choice-of-anchor B domain-containing protein
MEAVMVVYRSGGSASFRSFRTLPVAACVLVLALATDAARAGSFDSFNVDLVSHVPLDDCSDVNSEGDLVYVGRQELGVSIIDVSTPATPSVLTTWAHPSEPIKVQDLRALNGDVWLSNEAGSSFCVVGLDLTNPSAPTILAELSPPMYLENVHNMWPSGNYLYLAAYGPGRMNHIVDLTNPAAPVLAANFDTDDIHDVIVVNDVLYVAGGVDATYLVDVTDPTDPIEIVSFAPHVVDTIFYQHNAYPIRDTGYVVVTEEVGIPTGGGGFAQGSVRVWDTTAGPPVPVWRWKSETAKTDPNVTPHNAYVVDDFMYVSAYQDGLKVFDVSDPTDPVEVAFFDTYPQLPTGLFEGNWGVDAFQGNDRIFLSDRLNGFFHVTFNGARRATLEGRVLDAITMLPIPGAAVEDETALRSFTAGAGGTFTEKTGAGTHAYLVQAPGYHDRNASVVLVANTTTNHDFLLTPDNVSTEEVPEAPVLRLRAARPNPFNPLTTLGFDVPAGMAGERMTLRVFDMRGQLVRTLLDGTANAGEGAVSWDGRNDAGFRMGSGAFLARLELGGRAETQKVVLAR